MTFVFVNLTLHPASHKMGAATKLFTIPGSRCPVFAFSGRLSIFSCIVSVVLILAPFGIVTRFSFLGLVIYLLVHDCAVDELMLQNLKILFGLHVTGWPRRFFRYLVYLIY